MPQVLAKCRRCFVLVPLVLLSGLGPSSPVRADGLPEREFPRALGWLLPDLGAPWLAGPTFVAWLVESVDNDAPIDSGGAAMDPAGSPHQPGSTTQPPTGG